MLHILNLESGLLFDTDVKVLSAKMQHTEATHSQWYEGVAMRKDMLEVVQRINHDLCSHRGVNTFLDLLRKVSWPWHSLQPGWSGAMQATSC